MPQAVDAKNALVKVLSSDIQTALAGLSLTNTNVTFSSTAAYYAIAPEQKQGTAYVIYTVPSEVDGIASDRNKEESTLLIVCACWAPDPGSALEMAEAVKEHLTAWSAGKSTNLVVSGFVVYDCRREYQNTITDAPPGRAPMFGESLGLITHVRPT